MESVSESSINFVFFPQFSLAKFDQLKGGSTKGDDKICENRYDKNAKGVLLKPLSVGSMIKKTVGVYRITPNFYRFLVFFLFSHSEFYGADTLRYELFYDFRKKKKFEKEMSKVTLKNEMFPVKMNGERCLRLAKDNERRNSNQKAHDVNGGKCER